MVLFRMEIPCSVSAVRNALVNWIWRALGVSSASLLSLLVAASECRCVGLVSEFDAFCVSFSPNSNLVLSAVNYLAKKYISRVASSIQTRFSILRFSSHLGKRSITDQMRRRLADRSCGSKNHKWRVPLLQGN